MAGTDRRELLRGEKRNHTEINYLKLTIRFLESHVKPSREQEREPTSAVGKEKEKKEKETTSVTGENKPQGQESKGNAKDEKRRSDDRRVRNKVSHFVTKW